MLVFAEDAVDEIYEVLRTTFRGHRNLASAYRFLAALLHRSELVARTTYVERLPEWIGRVRDPKDAALFACASASRADSMVSGDHDVQVLRRKVPIKVLRTRDLLALIGES